MKKPKKNKNAARPSGKSRKAGSPLDRLQAQMEETRILILNILEGTGSAEDENKVNENLKNVGGLLGFSPEEAKQDPQKLQKGMLQAFKAISKISKNALETGRLRGHAESEQLFALIRDFETDLAHKDEELNQLLREAEKQQQESISNEPSEGVEPDRQELNAIQSKMEALLSDESMGFESLFQGMERIMEQFSKRLGIEPAQERDIVAEVSEQVSKDLGEANKKNMIGEDFDWSSIWRKD